MFLGSLSVAPPLPSVYQSGPASGPALAQPPPVGCTDLHPGMHTHRFMFGLDPQGIPKLMSVKTFLNLMFVWLFFLFLPHSSV